jgi:hypothetical protein
MEVGDYITYTGNLIQDKPCLAGAPMSSCQYISAHTVVVELGLYTAPGAWPAYVAASEFVFGVGGVPNPIFPQEALEKIFGDFFTTDSSQLVDFYSEDINSTTGDTTHRFYGTADPFGPPLGGLKGRARFRVTIGNFLPPTRNMALASRTLTRGAPLDSVLPNARLAANGMIAGFYTAPQFGFIFPENRILGSLQIPFTFQEFPFLTNGSGPYVPFNSADGLPVGTLGQLNPWPGLAAPPALANSTGMSLIQPPVSNAGPPQTVPSGSTVTLSGAGSTDTNVPAMPLIYTWQQVSGPPVVMLNMNNMQPTQTFVAPTLAAGSAPVVLAIQLAVCNGITCGGISTVNVTVVAAAAAPAITLSSSKTLNIVPNSSVTLTAVATCGGGACPTAPVFAQTAGPHMVLSGTGSTRTFAAVLPAGTVTPAMLTFTATVTNAGKTSTATISVFVGSDTITPTLVSYILAKSALTVTVNTNALPKGAAIITVTPLVNGKVSGPSLVAAYDPGVDSYFILGESFIVNPVPDAVRITSNYGATITTPLTVIR